jgi:hypothetical protein
MSMLTSLLVPDIDEHDPARLRNLRNTAPPGRDHRQRPPRCDLGTDEAFHCSGISRERDQHPRRGESAGHLLGVFCLAGLEQIGPVTARATAAPRSSFLLTPTASSPRDREGGSIRLARGSRLAMRPAISQDATYFDADAVP